MWQHFTDRTAGGLAVNRTDGGWSYSLVSALGIFLRDLETRYGERVCGFTLLGIEFGGENPGIWFPGNCNHLAIRLSDNARNDHRKALYQLAHESVHLLAPSHGKGVVAEEGLAVAFEREMSSKYELNMYGDSAGYNAAGNLAEQLLAIDEGIVKRVRVEEPIFDRWTPELLERHGVPTGLAAALCMPFTSFIEMVRAATERKDTA